MTESVQFKKEEIKCPLGFTSWFGKKPDIIKNQ